MKLRLFSAQTVCVPAQEAGSQRPLAVCGGPTTRVTGKRHILTDTDGRLLAFEVHGANIQDREEAKGVLQRSRSRFPFVELAYVDGGHTGRLVRWAKDWTHIVLEVVKRSAEQVGFAVIQRRWVVERTFAWIIKNRRFVRDTSNSRQSPKPQNPRRAYDGDGWEIPPIAAARSGSEPAGEARTKVACRLQIADVL